MDKPKTLVFVASSNADDASFASTYFASEARKMDVFWTSSVEILPSDDALKSLQSSDLAVVLQRPGGGNILQSYAPNWNGKSEIWNLPAGDDVHSVVEKSIGSLMIKLILQGGKRAPLAPMSPSKVSQQDLSGNSVAKSNVRVMRESKGRKGKTVTVISGLGMDDGHLFDLAASLKQLCGTGGTVKDGKIEIQGDQCERVLNALHEKGFKAKRAGG